MLNFQNHIQTITLYEIDMMYSWLFFVSAQDVILCGKI
jgi:hypothetical protein